MDSFPPYRARHQGVVLVCGNGFPLADDLARARGLFPDAPAIAVNGAAKEVPAFALFTLHPEKMPVLWAAEQRRRFGTGFTTHTGGKAERQDAPGIDHWWPEAAGRGTSTWAAAKMARLMGFDRIVLCGMPLEPGPYADGRPAFAFMRRQLEGYRAYVAGDTAWHRGVSSLSGWTRDLFGEPDVEDDATHRVA